MREPTIANEFIETSLSQDASILETHLDKVSLLYSPTDNFQEVRGVKAMLYRRERSLGAGWGDHRHFDRHVDVNAPTRRLLRICRWLGARLHEYCQSHDLVSKSWVMRNREKVTNVICMSFP